MFHNLAISPPARRERTSQDSLTRLISPSTRQIGEIAFDEKKGEGSREDFEKVLLEKLLDVLSPEQKKNKVKNILQKMKRERKIRLGSYRTWILDEL